MKKKGLQISFAWLFAIIVGAFILFLAIYGVTRLINLGQYEISTETGKQIGILLNPLETGFETGKVTSLTLARETRIYNDCDNDNSFGRQIISISQKNFGRWPEPAEGVSFRNKYIFSQDIAEGKEFYIFSKPFEFPFKVSDLIYLISSSEEYCFINAPPEIEDEILDLEPKNIVLDSLDGCSDKSVKVCFVSATLTDSSANCDIEVNRAGGFIEKAESNGSKRVYFGGDALMYAGIFADSEIYECQIKRLMQRAGQLASLYKDKEILVSQQDCYSNLKQDLLLLSNSANSLTGSKDLGSDLINLVEDIKQKNENSYCKLW
jgi:hypothetical protein